MGADVTGGLRRLMAHRKDGPVLARGALEIARLEYPDLDPDAYLRRLDDYAERVRAGGGAGLTDQVLALNRILFREEGYAGNLEEYYDPRNSFLNEVMDRRLGLPITLSIVYLEVGRRVGLPVEGVSFPGHFLVKLPVQGGALVLDPFDAGRSLDEEDLQEQLAQVYGDEPAPLVAGLLNAASPREILVRLLRNLKGVYLRRNQLEKVLEVMNCVLAIAPELAPEVRDRGRLLERLECLRPALEDYQRYLELVPDAADSDQVRRDLIRIQQDAQRIH
jgi:regulator of sirC expression with transglutaminase-like and TPR domain